MASQLDLGRPEIVGRTESDGQDPTANPVSISEKAPAPSQPEEVRVIGLMGGVAAGKSVVAGLLAERGCHVLDADRVARSVLDRPELRATLLEMFGPKVETSDKTLDRSYIADQVFQQPDLRTALERLVHPEIRAALLGDLERALVRGECVVLDVPLLLEKGLIERCDLVIFVDVRDSVRRARALARGLSAEDWARREAAQAPLRQKRARADVVIDNSGSPAATRIQLDRIHGLPGEA